MKKSNLGDHFLNESSVVGESREQPRGVVLWCEGQRSSSMPCVVVMVDQGLGEEFLSAPSSS